MGKNNDLKIKVMMAARDNGISSILFRNAMARKFDLNLTESMCLSVLGINNISSPKDLARYAGLTTGSTTTLLDRLEKKNIIIRKPNPNDRRGVIIEVTDEYAEKAKEMVQGVQKLHRELFESYSDKDLEVIADFLNRFTGNIETATKELEREN